MSIVTPQSKTVADAVRWSPRWSTQKFEDAEARQRSVAALAGQFKQFEDGRITWRGQLMRWGDLVVEWAKRHGCTIEQAAYAWLPREFKLDFARRMRFAYAVDEFAPNSLVNAGINEFWTLIAGSGGTAFTNANAAIGVGSDNSATTADMTDLQGGSKTRAGMEAGYPTYGTSQKATWESEFEGAEANHAWAEHAVFNATENGDMANRKVEDEGTKTAGQVWVEDHEITLS